jgi:hypothetical protein
VLQEPDGPWQEDSLISDERYLAAAVKGEQLRSCMQASLYKASCIAPSTPGGTTWNMCVCCTQ